ncbi:keratin-associated protein 29-1 [Hipposideros larvatus]
MADSCFPGNAMAIPAVPTISICPNGGNFRNGLCLPSSCRNRTWQLVTCQENCQPASSAPSGCEPVPCQPTCLPATSCMGFVCQPICSCSACYESGTGHSPCLISLCQPPCSESTGGQAKCCDVSPCKQSSHQEPVFVSRSCQAACGQSVCCDTKSCQPSCSEVTSCLETSCPPTVCAASPCQPTCCQAGSCQPIGGEDQPRKSTYYQPICYIFKTCQSVPYMPAPCQPPTCAFSSCNPTCCVSSPCQLLHCQPASSIPFICQPVANCQPPASCGTMLSGRPTCGRPTSCNPNGCKSPSYQPACCVTGLGRSSSGGSNCFQATPPHLGKGSTYLPTSCQPSRELSSFCKATCG